MKNRYTPAYPNSALKKWGIGGYILHGHVILMHVRQYKFCLQVFLYKSFNLSVTKP